MTDLAPHRGACEGIESTLRNTGGGRRSGGQTALGRTEARPSIDFGGPPTRMSDMGDTTSAQWRPDSWPGPGDQCGVGDVDAGGQSLEEKGRKALQLGRAGSLGGSAPLTRRQVIVV